MVSKTSFIAVLIALSITTCVWADELARPDDQAVTAAVEVGNKKCPVSGQTIGDMGPAVKFEYNNKIYNFCCPGCIESFKADPDTFIKIVEEELSAQQNAEEVKEAETEQK